MKSFLFIINRAFERQGMYCAESCIVHFMREGCVENINIGSITTDKNNSCTEIPLSTDLESDILSPENIKNRGENLKEIAHLLKREIQRNDCAVEKIDILVCPLNFVIDIRLNGLRKINYLYLEKKDEGKGEVDKGDWEEIQSQINKLE